MRSLLAPLVGLVSLAGVLGFQEDIENLKSRPGPNRNTSCPFFFNTSPNFMTGTGQNVTNGVPLNSTFGSLIDSVHYQLTFQKMNWGRNTWIQHRFLSNIQDLPIQDVTVCLMLQSWAPFNATYEPQFEDRIKISPRVKGTQPQAQFFPNVSSPYTGSTPLAQGSKTWCVTVPWVKAAGMVKVNLLFSSNECSTAIVWRGWAEFKNPFDAIYPASPDYCFASNSPSSPNRLNSVRPYGTDNRKIPLSCGTCTAGRNCKARAAGGPKKNEPYP